MAASDCNFEIQAELNVILNETCRSLKQQGSSPWPFMPEFRLLCYLLHSQMLSLSLPCNWLVRPWNYVLRKSKQAAPLLHVSISKPHQVHCYMVLWASTTRSGAYTVLLKIVWCVYSNWRLVVRLKVESRGLRAPAWEQFCHLWPENIIYFPNVYSLWRNTRANTSLTLIHEKKIEKQWTTAKTKDTYFAIQVEKMNSVCCFGVPGVHQTVLLNLNSM